MKTFGLYLLMVLFAGSVAFLSISLDQTEANMDVRAIAWKPCNHQVGEKYILCPTCSKELSVLSYRAKIVGKSHLAIHAIDKYIKDPVYRDKIFFACLDNVSSEGRLDSTKLDSVVKISSTAIQELNVVESVPRTCEPSNEYVTCDKETSGESSYSRSERRSSGMGITNPANPLSPISPMNPSSPMRMHRPYGY